MSFPPTSRRRPAAILAAAAALVLPLAACAPSAVPASNTPSAVAATGLPSAHIHGLSVNGETGQVLLATHEGLFDVSTKPAVKIGPTNDLMGFTAAMEQGVFYASGHPGTGPTLPSPLGLITTSDGGKTWGQLSRQGESDFHSLTTTKSGVVAFDGTLRTSPDGKTWKTAASSFTPAALAGNPYSDTVLATTQEGLQRSTDGGATWGLDKAAPVIQFAAFASATEAVGVEPGGAVHYSPDGGATWTRKGQISGAVQAVAATEGSDGNPWIWAATSTGLVVSTDGGATFRPADAV
ncbi:F510_1955 family glycosylhydrolase [Arthrobacter sp. UYCu723]